MEKDLSKAVLIHQQNLMFNALQLLSDVLHDENTPSEIFEKYDKKMMEIINDYESFIEMINKRFNL